VSPLNNAIAHQDYEKGARILVSVPDLSMPDLILLDKVQKQKRIGDEEIKYLRKRNTLYDGVRDDGGNGKGMKQIEVDELESVNWLPADWEVVKRRVGQHHVNDVKLR
jgi:hypothetical protein